MDPSLSRIVIVYEVIGEPFSSGADQLITTSTPLFEVVGADGYSGAIACKIVRLLDVSL